MFILFYKNIDYKVPNEEVKYGNIFPNSITAPFFLATHSLEVTL